MKKILSLLAFSPIALSTLGYSVEAPKTNSQSDNVLAGYLDVTAMGTATDLDMKKVKYDGYNEVVLAFANIEGSDISFPESSADLAQQKTTEAQDADLKTIVSVGGENNTYKPNGADTKKLAQNIVNFLHKDGYAGIDFDIEIAGDEDDAKYLKELVADIKKIDNKLEIIIAPQIMGDVLVSTGNSEFYKDLLSEKGLVDYIYVQNYNTVPEQDPSFTKDAYTITSSYSKDSDAKIVIGFPATAAAAGLATVYYPDFNGDYNDTENLPGPEDALNTYEAMKSIFPYLSDISVDSKFAGFMSWSLNTDYFGYTFPGDYPEQADGSFGYYMAPCAFENKCSEIPKDKIRYGKSNIDVYVNDASDFPDLTDYAFFGLDAVKFVNKNPAANKYNESLTTTNWYGPGNSNSIKAYAAPATKVEVSVQGKYYTCKTSDSSNKDLEIDTQQDGKLSVRASKSAGSEVKVSCQFEAS